MHIYVTNNKSMCGARGVLGQGDMCNCGWVGKVGSMGGPRANKQTKSNSIGFNRITHCNPCSMHLFSWFAVLPTLARCTPAAWHQGPIFMTLACYLLAIHHTCTISCLNSMLSELVCFFHIMQNCCTFNK